MDAFLRYGFEAAESFLEALAPQTAAVVATAASPSATPETGTQPAAAPPIVEPDPDLDSGQGTPGPVPQGAGLGDNLYMQEPKGAPLFVNGVQVETAEVRQGFLLNCPLPAAMAAMAHVPAGQAKIRAMITEILSPVDSSRQRKATEYFVNQQPKTLRAEQFVSSRSFDVKLRTGTVRVTPQLYHDLTDNDTLHYSRSTAGALWPSLIEKAYVVNQGNTYQAINGNLSAVEALEALHGPASEISLKPSLKNTTLIGILKKHGERPTIAGSLENQEEGSPITGHHAYVVVGFTTEGEDKVTLYDALSGKTVELSLADFRSSFGEVVYAK